MGLAEKGKGSRLPALGPAKMGKGASYVSRMRMRIELTESEMLNAAIAGARRYIENRKKGNPKINMHKKESENGWNTDIEGAMAECAAAKALNRYWPGKGEPRDVDCTSFDVRKTKYRKGFLPLHPEDPDGRPFVLVTGEDGIYFILGWIYAKEGKVKSLWRDPGGDGHFCFCVPQSMLNKIEG